MGAGARCSHPPSVQPTPQSTVVPNFTAGQCHSQALLSGSRTKTIDTIISPQKGEDMSLDRHSFGDGAA